MSPLPQTTQLRLATADDRDQIAALIRDSTNHYYETRLGAPAIFPKDRLSTTAFVDLYTALEDSESILCIEADGTIIGSCFYHPRETHASLGIMNVHPEHFGKGVAKKLLKEILRRSKATQCATRLVSSCQNLDSYSLYTRAGFTPYEIYQDMLVAVPAEGFDVPEDHAVAIRNATRDDINAMAALELAISGISRRNDYRHFIENSDGLWHVSLALKNDKLIGFMISSAADACNMIGPGVAQDEGAAFRLVLTELNQHRGRTPVLLIPSRFSGLVKSMYSIGGRNCEMHVAQSTQSTPQPAGITLPTFFPETG
jgi:GNAT superfamily N-acetyltransferase